jgi:hypothetical protein
MLANLDLISPSKLRFAAWIGIVALAFGFFGCGGTSSDPEEAVATRGSLAMRAPAHDNQLKIDSATQASVAVNPNCLNNPIGSTLDPQIDPPSAAALAQLAPTGTLRVAINGSNALLASRNAQNMLTGGTSVDLACRLAARLNVPLQFVGINGLDNYPTSPALVSDTNANKWDIGFALEPLTNTSNPPGVLSNYHIAIENVFVVLNGSPFQSTADVGSLLSEVDQPGIKISAQTGTSPAAYLAKTLKFATLVSTGPAPDNFNRIKLAKTAAGYADIAVGGRAAGLTFANANGARLLLPPFVNINLGPWMSSGKPAGSCYLTDYIEAARASGLLQLIIDRSAPTPAGRIGRTVPPRQPVCAKCQDVTVSADGSCHGSASINAVSNDGTCTHSASQFGLGATLVTLTCTDGKQQVTSCTGTVSVVDTTPPVIACPADQMLECSAEGAVASFAPTVTDNCGASVTCTPPSGTNISEDSPTAVSCVAVDNSGNRASCRFQIAVQDALPPVVTTKADANGFIASLWPPNHAYHRVSLADCIKEAIDTCDGAAVTSAIVNVTSDEPESGKGDNTCNDIVIVDSTHVQLRAERNGKGDGRVYSISAAVTDDDGNSTPVTCNVEVRKHLCGEPAVANAAVYCVGQNCGAVPGHNPHCKQHEEEGNDDGDDAEEHCGGHDDHGGGKDR